MKDNLLTDLWYNYFLDQCAIIKEKEEKESLSRTATLEKELIAELSPAQQKTLEKFAEAMHDTNSFLVEKAFICGVRFSTAFLLEILNK